VLTKEREEGLAFLKEALREEGVRDEQDDLNVK
jgi:hypothetical protein